MEKRNCLQAAENLLTIDRQAQYGDPIEMFERIAHIWTAILGVKVTAKQAALMMGGVKIARESVNPAKDNLDDACAYLRIGEIIEEKHG